LKSFKAHISYNVARISWDIFVHPIECVRGFNLNGVTSKPKDFLKVTDSHIYAVKGAKIRNRPISETMQDRDVVTTDH